jgi:hypothetical protein
MACGLVAVSVGLAAPGAEADLEAGIGGNQIVKCTGTEMYSGLNPTIKDGNATDHFARYVKASAKPLLTGHTKTYFGGVPLPNDATNCSIDAGIRANQAAQDVKYLLDDQTNGQTGLTLLKLSGSFVGSTQCDSSVGEIAGVNDYPTAYPLQGKLALTFNQLTAALKNIQMQGYVRIYSDADIDGDGLEEGGADTDSAFHVTGTVIKGPGVGGELTTAFTFLPTDSTKNINVVAGCTDGVSGNAAGAELYIAPADSNVDVDGTPQPLLVTISGDDANEVYDALP